MAESPTVQVTTRKMLEQTPLHTAAENGATDVALLLLSRKVSVFATDSSEQTPLHLAAKNGHNEIVSAILKNIPEKPTQLKLERELQRELERELWRELGQQFQPAVTQVLNRHPGIEPHEQWLQHQVEQMLKELLETAVFRFLNQTQRIKPLSMPGSQQQELKRLLKRLHERKLLLQDLPQYIQPVLGILSAGFTFESRLTELLLSYRRGQVIKIPGRCYRRDIRYQAYVALEQAANRVNERKAKLAEPTHQFRRDFEPETQRRNLGRFSDRFKLSSEPRKGKLLELALSLIKTSKFRRRQGERRERERQYLEVRKQFERRILDHQELERFWNLGLVNMQDNQGRTALHWAAKIKGNNEGVALLLEHGAHIKELEYEQELELLDWEIETAARP